MIDAYDPCPCGSGKKYKFCCATVRKQLSKTAKTLAGQLEAFSQIGKSGLPDLMDELEHPEEVDDQAAAAQERERAKWMRDSEDRDFDQSYARGAAIVGDDQTLDRREAIRRMFEHLQANLQYPFDVDGMEDFHWEERYVIGGWSQREYRRLMRTQPSYRDRYQLLSIHLDGDTEWIMYGGDIIARVKRVCDGNEFFLGLCELKAVDRTSANYELLRDYGVWFINSR